MINIDTVTFAPDNHYLLPELKNTILRSFRDCHGESWKITPRKRSLLQEGNEQWMMISQKSGVTAVCFDPEKPRLAHVQANMSRLLTGARHNGYVIRDQGELDQAMEALWESISGITLPAERRGHFNRVDIGGVMERPYSDFEQLLDHRNLPYAKTAPLSRRRQSIKFGAAKSSEVKISIYDKGRELNKKFRNGKNRLVTKIELNKFTRIEVGLSGKKLKNAFGGPVKNLNLSQCRSIFFKVLYRLHSEQNSLLTQFKGNMKEFLGLCMLNPEANYKGVSYVQLYANAHNARHVARTLKAARQYADHINANSLMEIVPTSPEGHFVDLDPDGSLKPFLDKKATRQDLEMPDSRNFEGMQKS